jgi:5,10-methylenetetrahydromethanopterin reductase
MRFGFMLFTRDLHVVGDVAQLAEERGFDLIGVADSPALSFDPYMALTLAAGATSRARIGTAVTNPQTRHPLIIANLAASLEALAPGRSFLGLGTGWSGVRHAGAPEARLETLGTTVRQVRRLLAGEAVEIGGATVGLPIGSRPVPILLAASGPKALRLAGAVADIALFNLGTVPEVLADGLGWIAEGAAAAGRSPAAIEPWLFIPAAISPDRAAAIEEVKSATVSSGAYVLRGDLVAKRVPPDVEAKLGELYREYRFGEHLSRGQTSNYRLAERLGLSEYLVERFSVAGTPEDCCRKIERLRAVGIANICFNLGTVNDLPATLDLFGHEVLPAFAGSP